MIAALKMSKNKIAEKMTIKVMIRKTRKNHLKNKIFSI